MTGDVDFLNDPVPVWIIGLAALRQAKRAAGRPKDLDDLRVLLPRLDRSTLTRRLLDAALSHLADQTLRRNAERNWYVLFGEPLPYTPPPDGIK